MAKQTLYKPKLSQTIITGKFYCWLVMFTTLIAYFQWVYRFIIMITNEYDKNPKTNLKLIICNFISFTDSCNFILGTVFQNLHFKWLFNKCLQMTLYTWRQSMTIYAFFSIRTAPEPSILAVFHCFQKMLADLNLQKA